MPSCSWNVMCSHVYTICSWKGGSVHILERPCHCPAEHAKVHLLTLADCVFVHWNTGVPEGGQEKAQFYSILLPPHLFPTYSTYRWSAVLMDRYALLLSAPPAHSETAVAGRRVGALYMCTLRFRNQSDNA